MKSRIRWTSEANRTYDKIVNFLVETNIAKAIEFKILTKDIISILDLYSHIGYKIKNHKRFPTCYRKLVMNKRYILIYYIYQKRIYIQAVLDCRQNNEKYLY